AGLAAYLTQKVADERQSASIREQNWRARDEQERREIETLQRGLQNAENQPPPVSPGKTSGNEQRDQHWKQLDEQQRRQIEELSAKLQAAEQKAAASEHPAPQLLAMLIPAEMHGSETPVDFRITNQTGLAQLQFNVDTS